MDPNFIIVMIVICLIAGAISATIAANKDRDSVGFFFLGFFLGVLGIIIAAVVSPGQPPPPKGMRGFTCFRCSADHNVAIGQPSFQCWQCKATNTVPA